MLRNISCNFRGGISSWYKHGDDLFTFTFTSEWFLLMSDPDIRDLSDTSVMNLRAVSHQLCVLECLILSCYSFLC